MATGEGYEEFEGSRFWSDEWIRSLMLEKKFAHILLFEWVWTGPMRSPSGLVQCPLAAVRSLAGFMGLSPKRFTTMVEEATEQPRAGLAWFPRLEYWWVKSYIGYRAKSPNKLIASARNLTQHPRELASLVVAYNQARKLDLMGLSPLAEIASGDDGFPFAMEILAERYEMPLATYLKPLATPNPNPNPNKNPKPLGVAKAPPGWNECRQAYHDGYLKTTGEKPVMDVVDFARLKGALTKWFAAEEAWQKLRAIIAYAVSGKDEAWEGSLPSLQTICSKHHVNRIQTLLAVRARKL